MIVLGGAALAVLGLGLWLGRPDPLSRPPVEAGDPAHDTARRMEAETLRTRAARLVKDAGVRPENLPEAVALLKQARDHLKPQAARDPAPYVAASEALREAEAARDAAADARWVDYLRQANLRDHAAAQGSLRAILRLVPDREDARNRRAREALAGYLGGAD